MTLQCLIAICAILMKNWDLSKWPPIGRGPLTGSRSPARAGGEGRGRELGCNGHNQPPASDLPPPPGARGEPAPGDWSQDGHLQSVTDPGGGPVAASTALRCFKATKIPCPCQQPLASKEVVLPHRRTPTPAAAHRGFLPQQIETVNIDSLFFQGFLMPSDT